MKKTMKFSLLCCSILLGTSTLYSQSLESAIKNVDISGAVAYRYDSFGNKGDSRGQHANRYKMGINLSSKINDDVKFNTRLLVGDTDNDLKSFMTTKSGDANLSLALSEVNFLYTGIKNSTLKVGKQHIHTPWTNNRSMFVPEVTGTGALATHTIDNISLIGGYFNQTNVSKMNSVANAGHSLYVNGTAYRFTKDGSSKDGGENIYYAGINGNFGFINAKYMAMQIEDVMAMQFVKVNLPINYNGIKANIYAQYSTSELESTFKTNTGVTEDDLSVFKIGLKAQKGIYSLNYAYGRTGKNGTGIINKQSESSTIQWTNSVENYYNADFHFANVNAQVTEKINLGLYGSIIDTKEKAVKSIGNVSDASDETMIYAQLVYKMSKNFLVDTKIGQLDNESYNDKSNQFRLDLLYTF